MARLRLYCRLRLSTKGLLGVVTSKTVVSFFRCRRSDAAEVREHRET